jgi:hypothetical protein
MACLDAEHPTAIESNKTACVQICSASTFRKRHTDNQETIDKLYAHTPTIIITCSSSPAGLLLPNRIIEQHGAAKNGRWRGSLLRSPKLN